MIGEEASGCHRAASRIDDVPDRAAHRDDRTVVDKVAGVLAVLRDEREVVGVSELARRAGLSKSTAFRLLGSLRRTGMVDRVGSGYVIGTALPSLGRGKPESRPDLVRNALIPYVTDLHTLTGQTVHLGVLHGSEVAYLTKIFGHRQRPPRPCPGNRFPAHCLAIGKALLAYAHDAESILGATPLQSFTPRTITSPERLLAELSRVRANGIAFDADEARVGVSAVAVPLRGPNGAVVAGLSILHSSADTSAPRYAALIRNVGAAANVTLRHALA